MKEAHVPGVIAVVLSVAATLQADIVRDRFSLAADSARSSLVSVFILPAQSGATLASGQVEAPTAPVCNELTFRMVLADAAHPSPSSAGLGCDYVAPASEERPSTLRGFPPPPSNLALAASGLLALGAMQLFRSAKQIQFAALPQWYHSACPERIGDAVPFDFDLSVQPLCLFATVLDGLVRPPVRYELRRDLSPRRGPQHFLSATAPRGPPFLAN